VVISGTLQVNTDVQGEIAGRCIDPMPDNQDWPVEGSCFPSRLALDEQSPWGQIEGVVPGSTNEIVIVNLDHDFMIGETQTTHSTSRARRQHMG